MKIGDRRPEFLRAPADLIEYWSSEQIANCRKFIFSKPTYKCHSAIIEDLLNEGHEFILSALSIRSPGTLVFTISTSN